MAGITNVKEAVLLGADIGNLIGALSDGLDPEDFAYLIPLAQSVFPAIQDIGEVDEELLDMDEAEAMEVQEALEQRFDLASEDTEEFVEDTFSVFLTGVKTLSLFSFVNKWFLSGRIRKL